MDAFALAKAYEARSEEAKMSGRLWTKWPPPSASIMTIPSISKIPPPSHVLVPTPTTNSSPVAPQHTNLLNKQTFQPFYLHQIYRFVALLQLNYETNEKKDCVITVIKSTA